MPVQADGTKRYCTPDSDGVSYHDITPRWGAVWDVFGTGRTSVKWNMGKYNNQAAISGIYSAANPARRTANSLQRGWNDLDGDRIVDCDLMNFATNGECGTFNGVGNDRHGPIRKRPARARRGRESHRARHGAVRTHGDRRLPAGAGLLRRVRRQPDQRLGQASLRVADRDWRSARDPAAAFGRGHLQPPPLSQPDDDRPAGSWLRSLQRSSGPGAVSATRC